MQKKEETVWYALRATYGRGLDAKTILDNDSVDNFIPQHYQICTTKNGHKERKLVPFLKDLIFACTTSQKIKEEKAKIPFLLYITKKENGSTKPVIVPETQMQQFIEVIETFNEQLIFLKPEEINLKQGIPVRVHGGLFDKREGVFLRVKGIRDRRVVISIDGVGAIVLATIHPDFIEVINK